MEIFEDFRTFFTIVFDHLSISISLTFFLSISLSLSISLFWHRNGNIWRFQNVFHNRFWSSLYLYLSNSFSLYLSISLSISLSLNLSLSLYLSLSLSISLSLSLSLFLRGITTRNIKCIQLCEIEFPTENWIRNCQWRLAKKWHYVQIMILSSVYKHHILKKVMAD